jgi:hypothetical protein
MVSGFAAGLLVSWMEFDANEKFRANPCYTLTFPSAVMFRDLLPPGLDEKNLGSRATLPLRQRLARVVAQSHKH